MTPAYINKIATRVPPHDIHSAFVRFAWTLLDEPHDRLVFDRLAAKAQIEQRFSVLPAAVDPESISVSVRVRAAART